MEAAISEPCYGKTKRSQNINKIFEHSSYRISLFSKVAGLFIRVELNSFSNNFQKFCLQFQKVPKEIK